MRLSRANVHRRAAPLSNYHVASRPCASASFFLPCSYYMALFAVGGSIGFWMLTMTKTHIKRLPQSFSSPPTQHLMREDGEDNPLHRNETGGIEYLWQLPMKKNGKTVDPEAILFLAHGCSHSMTDWWSQQSSCADCIGLPEERAIVDIAIHKFNFLVVAVSSLDRRSKCWGAEDGPRVAAVLTELQRTVATVPIYAFGASSGGVFVSSILPEFFLHETSAKRKFRGFVAQIAAPRTIFPSVPAIFITMSRDLRTERHFADLQNQYHRSLHLRVSPLSIGPTYFSDSIGSEFYPPESSRRMVEAIQLAGLLNENGRLLEDPRRSDWRKVLRPFAHHEDNLVADLSPLAEVLNVAWGMHEITRQDVEYALRELQRWTLRLTLSEAFGSQYG